MRPDFLDEGLERGGFMSRSSHKFEKISLILGGLLLACACNQTSFSPATANIAPNSNQVNPPAPSPSPPNPCVPVSQQSRLLKVMFLVDTSGSNFENNTTTDGTDPDKKFRLGSIQNFFNRYQTKTNIQWGFTSFSNDTVTDFVGAGGHGSFTSDPNQMQNALNQFSNLQDQGDTPYVTALNSVANDIANDPDLHSKANPLYYVIFLSDGYPTDVGSPSDIQNTISQLLATDPKNVLLSTVFYGHKSDPESPAALNMLGAMAKMGGGVFADATDPKSIIDIDQLLAPPPSQCPNP